MAAGGGYQQGGDTSGIIIFMLLALALMYFGTKYSWVVVQGLLALARVLMFPLSFFSHDYAVAIVKIGQMDPHAVSVSTVWDILCLPSRWYAWGLAVPCVFLLIKKGWRLSVADCYRRSLSMKKLLANNVPFNPCIAPAVNWPGGILSEPLDSGPWMAGRQPLQIVAANGLLVDSADGRRPVPENELLGSDHLADNDSKWLRPGTALVLDREKAAAVFQAQMGKEKWQGLAALPPYLKKLACAWIFYACDDKKTAQKLLDEMSLSFRAPQKAQKGGFMKKFPFWRSGVRGHPWLLDTGLSDADLKKAAEFLEKNRKLRKCFVPHQVWLNLALLGIYEAARAKGVLPTAEFIWLRPLNRRLFYLCNNMGRRTAWPEVAGPWTHYQAETLLNLAEPDCTGIEQPQVMEAVNALEVAMYDEGWIAPEHLSSPITVNALKLGIDLGDARR